MPRPSEYTPTRRYLMQAIMTAILGGTIVLAAVVGAQVRRTHRVDLSGDVFTAQDVSVRLPDKWQHRKVSDDPTIVVRAVEPGVTRGDESGSRYVDVRVERLPAPRSPMQFLISQVDLSGVDPRDRVTSDDAFEAIDMAGRTGVMLSFERGTRRRRSGMRKDVVAAVVLPSMRAVVVHLQGPGEADAYDLAVVREIAANLTVANEPEPGKPGESVTLVDGIKFAVPDGFTSAPQTDPNRTDRVLWPAVDDSSDDAIAIEHDWVTFETVGCLCPDFDAADPKQVERAKSTFATLLLVRDSRWRGATIARSGKKTWRADISGENSRGAAARAFLMTDPSGRALLTIARGGFGADDFDRPWEKLAASVTFLPASDIASLEDVGTAEASRLRREGYEKLLADRDLEWWLWTENDRHIGWSSIDFSRGQLAARARSRLRIPGGDGDDIVGVTGDFFYKDAGGKPQYEATISRVQSDGRGRIESHQTVALDDGQLSLSFKRPDTADVKWTIPAPPQYVPGALMPLVMGHLSKDPMILLTDAFPGRDGIGPLEPLTIIIRPGDAGVAGVAGTRPATTGDARLLRCLTTQVNGTGAITRWYFRPTGELERIEWPAGVKQLASDDRTVKNTFPRGDDMSP